MGIDGLFLELRSEYHGPNRPRLSEVVEVSLACVTWLFEMPSVSKIDFGQRGAENKAGASK
jgi:hypothetical protein